MGESINKRGWCQVVGGGCLNVCSIDGKEGKSGGKGGGTMYGDEG